MGNSSSSPSSSSSSSSQQIQLDQAFTLTNDHLSALHYYRDDDSFVKYCIKLTKLSHNPDKNIPGISVDLQRNQCRDDDTIIPFSATSNHEYIQLKRANTATLSFSSHRVTRWENYIFRLISYSPIQSSLNNSTCTSITLVMNKLISTVPSLLQSTSTSSELRVISYNHSSGGDLNVNYNSPFTMHLNDLVYLNEGVSIQWKKCHIQNSVEVISLIFSNSSRSITISCSTPPTPMTSSSSLLPFSSHDDHQDDYVHKEPLPHFLTPHLRSQLVLYCLSPVVDPQDLSKEFPYVKLCIQNVPFQQFDFDCKTTFVKGQCQFMVFPEIKEEQKDDKKQDILDNGDDDIHDDDGESDIFKSGVPNVGGCVIEYLGRIYGSGELSTPHSFSFGIDGLRDVIQVEAKLNETVKIRDSGLTLTVLQSQPENNQVDIIVKQGDRIRRRTANKAMAQAATVEDAVESMRQRSRRPQQ